MNIDRLRCFISVAKNLSFTKAGAECYLAQTAVSRHISALEEELGMVLFERNNRQVKLTNTGVFFYKEIFSIVEQYDNAVLLAKKMTLGGEGKLKIGIGQYERYFVSALVREFLAAFPNAEVIISQYLYKDLANHLKSGEVDIIFALPIISQYVDTKRMVVKKLFPSETVLVVSQNHPLAKLTEIKSEEYLKYPLITIGEDEGPCDLRTLQGIVEEQGVVPQKYIQVNSLDSGLLMVEANMGMMFIPDFLHTQFLHAFKCIRSGKISDSYFACLHMMNNTNPTLKLFVNGISTSGTLGELKCIPIME